MSPLGQILFGEAEQVANLVAQRDADLLDQLLLVAARVLERALEEDDAIRQGMRLASLPQRERRADVDAERRGAAVLVPAELARRVVLDADLAVGEPLAERAGHLLERARQRLVELG